MLLLLLLLGRVERAEKSAHSAGETESASATQQHGGAGRACLSFFLDGKRSLVVVSDEDGGEGLAFFFSRADSAAPKGALFLFLSSSRSTTRRSRVDGGLEKRRRGREGDERKRRERERREKRATQGSVATFLFIFCSLSFFPSSHARTRLRLNPKCSVQRTPSSSWLSENTRRSEARKRKRAAEAEVEDEEEKKTCGRWRFRREGFLFLSLALKNPETSFRVPAEDSEHERLTAGRLSPTRTERERERERERNGARLSEGEEERVFSPLCPRCKGERKVIFFIRSSVDLDSRCFFFLK